MVAPRLLSGYGCQDLVSRIYGKQNMVTKVWLLGSDWDMVTRGRLPGSGRQDIIARAWLPGMVGGLWLRGFGSEDWRSHRGIKMLFFVSLVIDGFRTRASTNPQVMNGFKTWASQKTFGDKWFL